MKKFLEGLILLFLVLCIVIFSVKSKSLTNKEAKTIKNTNNVHLIKNIIIKKTKHYTQQQLYNFFNREYLSGTFAGSVLISYKGHIIYSNAWGYANRAKKTPITTETIFQIGSMSKQFTAIAILQLVAKGIIHLNDEVNKFYPDFPYKGITIRMLLTHRSGLPNYVYHFEESKEIDKTKLMSNQDMVAWLIKNKPQSEAKPNTKYIYSNTGYALLAAIIENVTGQSYAQYIKENIFDPLGMSNSFFYTDLYNNKIDNTYSIATGYISPKQEAGFFYLNGILGDKGLFSNIEDLHKWDTSLYKSYILPKNWIDTAFSIQTKTRKANIFYGFGWKLYFLKDSTPVQFHSGWWQGYQSVIIRMPNDTITIIVLKNKKTKHPVNQRAIIDILYPNNNFWNSNRNKNCNSNQIITTSEEIE
ncbi:MAG: beta-lactamase family protein [Bacteroidales bacterium]|nr:beta-lactamase family protein [Bacteroidales bacterium]